MADKDNTLKKDAPKKETTPRKIIGWIKDLRDLLKYTEISAYEDEQELKRIKGEGGK